MKNTEEKILNKIYVYETSRTVFDVLVRIVIFLIGITTFLIVSLALTERLAEQETFDLFTNISSDPVYILQAIYEETPKLLIIFVLLIFLIVAILWTHLYKQREKFIRRITSGIHYFLSNKK